MLRIKCGVLEFGRAEGEALNGNLPHLHLIAGQGASLVTEDILHLAQVLIQVAVAGLCKVSRAGILQNASADNTEWKRYGNTLPLGVSHRD